MRSIVLASATLAALGLAVAAPAAAVPGDAEFLRILDTHGIPYADADQITDVGESVCQYVADGHSAAEAVAAIAAAEGFTEQQSEIFVQGAIASYCSYLA
ncbi:DUF732 domain-containing protein [uncultured Mycolicibacterium sp.]|uniref:DUF732 domain-containing protein n=1 Tax=uncultured Mycolicibacterium sp. TaxID=2320817 RepID=UPI00260C1EA8|nr:DUF732 domain-containing protein [uncultured Mycolicibacterium sp.]